ncbi:YafY family transcriptional regulator [Leptotrichia sp. OH3620_COT-345]|uniref:helix-turn-helix transcriptional regulator n=1 Tax=Leptotrichia sp. OH3620_COT-345 TaxID=2491048 RepID=UPI000F64579D|nr:YafY family protein [Leptotrichia sp. OH3620_COT-345]RRD38899.1 YafY family transcriptional regulator [Leptotrichia sp. OH3620_COT-345]
MNKSERINDMIMYFNKISYFNLQDIIRRYNISRSTALRDIETVERIGVPIYSEKGKNGGYRILSKRLLAPVIFTIDEIHALYFCMLTLRGYETTPFDLNIDKLEEKFRSCLPDERLKKIEIMKKVLQFEIYKHKNSSPLLKKILEAIIENKICNIEYNKKGNLKNYKVQFFRICASYAQWYAEGINCKNGKIRIFRCDKIIFVDKIEECSKYRITDILKKVPEIYRNEKSVDFEIKISEKALDIFYKENYPSMRLVTDNGENIIKGFYNENEEKFIADYFLKYGENIISIEPQELKEFIRNEIKKLAVHFNNL